MKDENTYKQYLHYSRGIYENTWGEKPFFCKQCQATFNRIVSKSPLLLNVAWHCLHHTSANTHGRKAGIWSSCIYAKYSIVKDRNLPKIWFVVYFLLGTIGSYILHFNLSLSNLI